MQNEVEDAIARWKNMIDEENPAGMLELDDLDNFLGATGVCSAGCSNVSSACCCSGGAPSCACC